MIDAATEQGVTIPADVIFQHLDDLRTSRGGIRLEAKSDLAEIDRITGEFSAYLDEIGKRDLTPKELQQFKKDTYESINWDVRRQTGTPAKEATYKAAARGAKDAIAQEFPDAPEINRALSELYDLQPQLEQAAKRIADRNLLSINAPINIGAGGIIGDILGSGGVGLTVGAIGAVLGNPKVKARVAIALDKLKQGDTQWIQDNIGRQEVLIALALAGRNQQLSDQPATQQ
jgi:phosphopantetheinyl transferase (holo-ACP synthase)